MVSIWVSRDIYAGMANGSSFAKGHDRETTKDNLRLHSVILSVLEYSMGISVMHNLA